ncbi:unnamed protein product [Sphagnum jensenii]|uniref:Uncharacterized protein n=1 Tax=Sphagnum jensenii TaxID=128206 RepID=A0ABP1AJD2_9BRYO
MPIEVPKDIAAVDAARSNAAAARDEVSVHKSEEEKGMLGAKASWSFVSTSPAAASVHPIEEVDDKDLPFFHDNDLPSFHIKRLRKLRFRVASNRNNGNLLLKQLNNTKEQEFSRCSGSTTVVVVEQGGAAVCHNHTTTAPKGDDERQKLMQRENLQKLSDEVVVANVVPQHMTALASDNLLSDGKLGVMSSSIPQEQGDASFDEKPPTRRDLPAEASKNATEEAEEIAEAEALIVGLHEAPKPASLVTANSQEEMDMTAATSRESSAAKGETVVPFAHDPITSTSDETEASHVRAAKEGEEEAIEVHMMPTSIKDARRDVSLPDPQDLEEEESPNKHDGFLGESAAADVNELLVGHYYTTQNGDIPDPSDSDDRSSQGRDSVSSFATIHTRSDGDSSKLCERSSVSDVMEVYTDVAGVPSSRSIRYSSSILAAYSSGSILYPGAPNHSGSISHRSDSSAASNRSFAFPIFATDGNSSPVRMAQPDQRYLRRKKWQWQTSCTCCSRASPTYY